MSNFNYKKAYCTQAVPAFNGLAQHVKQAHALLLPLVADLQQGKDLNIPLNDSIIAIINPLTIEEIANLSRASYFIGYWYPSLIPRIFNTAKGESWKVSNCLDQVLRSRLAPLPHNIEIHEGKFRVTFSNRDCWLWDEFALATEKNLDMFKTCGLLFEERTIEASAALLADLIGDLWPDVDTLPDNSLYTDYLLLAQEKNKQDIQAAFTDKIKDLEKAKINAQREIDFLLLCNSLFIPIDNVIYYTHTDKFCFGWRSALLEQEKQAIQTKLADCPYNIEFK